MKITLLPNAPIFPDPRQADADGLVGLSRDLSPERMLAGYEQGIFPWYQEQGYYFWFSPDPRMMMKPTDLHIQKSMRPYLNQHKYKVSFDRSFKQVIHACAAAKRPEQESTWISPEFIEAYYNMHLLGYGHSVEVWQDDKLVGGLYGLSIGKVFFGESMFSLAPNASKFGYIKLILWLQRKKFKLIDCQVYTRHLARLGARNVPRADFLNALEIAKQGETLIGKWRYAEG